MLLTCGTSMFLGCYNVFFQADVQYVNRSMCRWHLQYSSDIRCLILFCFEFLYRFWKFNLCHPCSIPCFSNCFSFLLPPPGVEMRGILTLSAVTKSTTALSAALWEPHISMLSHFIWHFNFYCVARLSDAKQRKTGAILAQQQSAAVTCGSDSFPGVMGWNVATL